MDTINIDFEQCQALIQRIEQSKLSDEDQYLTKRMIAAYLSLTNELNRKNASIARLKELAFGKKRRKSYGMKSKDNKEPDANKKSKPPRNKGRNSVDVYTGAERETVQHESLGPGAPCPLLCGGKVYYFKPRQDAYSHHLDQSFAFNRSGNSIY